jgi:hypothetical protein
MALLGMLAACSGRIETSGDAGAPSGPGPATQEAGAPTLEGGEPTIGLCPTDQPTPGQACSSPSEQSCGYLNAGQPCVIFQCDASGHWQPDPHGC